jgi:hypothetical protein
VDTSVIPPAEALVLWRAKSEPGTDAGRVRIRSDTDEIEDTAWRSFAAVQRAGVLRRVGHS